MAQFIQPQNREADLNAILEGYEGRIEHQHWLSDAFQKDGIQNSWDARTCKKGTDWSCTIFYKTSGSVSVIGVVDKGTTGLTGSIPETQEEEVEALVSEDPKERLAYFLSSNWSKKAEDALGSRGRGKMIFLGASNDKVVYFDSLRSDDGEYVFGKTYLDQNKSISVEVHKGEDADKMRASVFGQMFDRLEDCGTRIFVPNPRKDLLQAFQDGYMEQHVQYTWWEILQKYNAKIELDNNGWKKQVAKSSWMPVNQLGVSETEDYELISLPRNKDLKIKRVSFCYLGEKEIPDSYKGLSVQRFGMVVERIPVSRLIGESIGEKIIGAVELEKELEKEIRDNEGPEHYSIFWTRSIPAQLRSVLREKAMLFARKYRLIEEERKNVSKEQRLAEVAAQKELNELAKSLGFVFGNEVAPRDINREKRKPDEKLRLSIPDFVTPYANGRVDTGQSVKGLYAVPISELEEQLKVLVRVWVVHKDGIAKRGGKELLVEKEMVLPCSGQTKVGWDELLISDEFETGKYAFKAKMIAMEDKKLSPTLKVEKGQEVYGPTGRTFYVNEDPTEKGIFRFQRVSKNDKTKYYWWAFEDNTWIIYYNGEHPIFKPIINDPDKLKEELRKIGILVAFAIVCSIDFGLHKEGKAPKVFKTSEIKEASFEELMQLVIGKQSEILWKKSEE